MVGEHYPSGWNDKQVSIDFIGGTSSLTGEVIDSTAGVSSSWCPMAS